VLVEVEHDEGSKVGEELAPDGRDVVLVAFGVFLPLLARSPDGVVVELLMDRMDRGVGPPGVLGVGPQRDPRWGRPNLVTVMGERPSSRLVSIPARFKAKP
jgi:hypothetical protein